MTSINTMDSETATNNARSPPTIFKTFSDGYIVQSMTADDVALVQKWYMKMGNTSKYDLEILFSIHPPGSPGMYAGIYKGETVATAIRVPWGTNIYYGSYYYVDERYRGQGFGTRLRDQVAMEHVGNNILCVDAVSSVTDKNISKFRYKPAFKSGRFQCKPHSSYSTSFAGKVLAIKDVAFEKLLEYDNQCFISKDFLQRTEFLKRWIMIPGGATYVTVDDNGQVTGFGCRRPCLQDSNHLIGPLYANNGDIAEALLTKLCSEVPDENVSINIWYPNQSAVNLLKKLDFEPVFELTRMHVNGDPKEYKDQVFALTSIDACGF